MDENTVTANNAVNSLIKTMLDQPDLQNDVLSYLLPSLVQLKTVLIETDEADPIFRHKIRRLAVDLLPETIRTYCVLPLDYRNTQIVRSKKTARGLLIEDLTRIMHEVGKLREEFHESQAKAFLAQGKRIEAVTAGANALGAYEEQSQPSVQFSNTFDIETWQRTVGAQATGALVAQATTIPMTSSARMVMIGERAAFILSGAIGRGWKSFMENTVEFRKEFKQGVKNLFSVITPSGVVIFLVICVAVGVIFSVIKALSGTNYESRQKLSAGLEHAWVLTRVENNPSVAASDLQSQIVQADLYTKLGPIQALNQNGILTLHIDSLERDACQRLESAILTATKPDGKTTVSVNQITIGKAETKERNSKRVHDNDKNEYFSGWEFQAACRLESNRIDVKIESNSALAK